MTLAARKRDASGAYERIACEIANEYAALSPKQRTRLLFILAHNLREELVKHLRKDVIKGDA